jgi:glycosyltransferase involved in cell wall biosynthesis
MNLLILLPNIENNSFQPQEIVNRQDIYGNAVLQNSQDETTRVTVFYSGCSQKLSSKITDLYCLSKKTTSIFEFSIKALRTIRHSRLTPDSIVAGTPFQPLLIALILKLFHSQAKIHTSIHGDLLSLIEPGVRNRIKLLFLRYVLKRCASIRFVSESQKQAAQQLISFSNQHLFTTPVPIPNVKIDLLNRDRETIAFVGRLQFERGVREWIEIASQFDQKQLLVIGDGPLRSEFQSELPGALFMGSLTQVEVQGQWNRIRVLLSSAPFESYGLAMREALLHGVPVVSRKNLGSLELQNRYPELIRVYETRNEAINHIRFFLRNSLSAKSFERFQSEFFANQDASLKKLAVAWRNAF